VKGTKCHIPPRHAVTPKKKAAFANPLDPAELPSRYKESMIDVYTFSRSLCNPIFSSLKNTQVTSGHPSRGTTKSMYNNGGAPWSVCITTGQEQSLSSSNSNGTTDMQNGEIYKVELDRKIAGEFGTAGNQLKEFAFVHDIVCRHPNEVYDAEFTTRRVQKLTLHPE
jgi:hypothetical protein